MTEINSLAILQQLDKLRLKENPYSAHTLAEENENNRRYYCALLFMVMLSHSQISEDQQRMLQLWLPTIGMEGRQAELCQLASRLGEDALDAVRGSTGQICFLLDCLVFCRINGPLNASQTTLLEALAAMLAITQDEMENVVYIACLILGLPVGEKRASDLLLGIHEISVWREFLADYIELLFLGLQSWLSENWLRSLILPENVSDLLKIHELDLYPDSWKNITPFPAGFSLLENLHSLRFDSNNINAFPGFSTLPCHLSFIEVGRYGEIRHIPDAICRLKKLKYLQIPDDYLSGISPTVYQFLSNNNVEHYISDSCFIKGPK